MLRYLDTVVHDAGFSALPFLLVLTFFSTNVNAQVRNAAVQSIQNTTDQNSDVFDYIEFRSARDIEYQNQLEQIAKTCDKLSLKAQADITRSWFIPRDPKRQYLFLPTTSETEESENSTGEQAQEPQAKRNIKHWANAFAELRAQQADWLFSKAKSFQESHPELSFQLIHETLHENPNHALARKMLGYSLEDDQWVRREHSIRTRKASYRHDALPAGKFWQADSGNFKIITTADEATARDVAEKLERWYDIWQQTFYTFWSPPNQLNKMFADQTSINERTRRHVVIVYRDKDEYDRQLGPLIPGIEISAGYYTDKLNQSFFYVGDEKDETNWRHELTHQLFDELTRGRRVRKSVATDHGAWLLEGIAMYMESLRDFGSYVTIGGFESERLQFARLRRFREGFRPVPELLMQKGMQELQTDDNVVSYYATSAGYCHFLMNADHGAYRQELFSYLSELYTHQSEPLRLLEMMETDSDSFDQQYAKFLFVSPNELAAIQRPEEIEVLSLVPSNASDQEMQFVSNMQKLTLLDLTATKITNESSTSIAKLNLLERLFLENTAVSDASMESIAKLPRLIELDLTDTAITNEGLKHLTAASNLKVLWLSGTKISDAGLKSLQSMKQLEMVDVSRTKVSDAAMQKLKSSLPNLR